MRKRPPAINVFRTGKPGLRKVLGDLEADIMAAVWSRGPGARVTVRDVVADLQGVRDSAYTTVMTVMGVLARKGMLRARKAGHAHVYEATCTEGQFADAVVGQVVRELLADFTAPALAHFATAIDRPADLGDWVERIEEARGRESGPGPAEAGR